MEDELPQCCESPRCTICGARVKEFVGTSSLCNACFFARPTNGNPDHWRRPTYTVREITEAVKADDGKNPLCLLPMESLEQVGLVLRHGMLKYDAHNWRHGMVWSRLISAGLRHFFAWIRGEKLDPDSGLPHLAHLSCCVLFLLSYELTNVGEDDRWVIKTTETPEG